MRFAPSTAAGSIRVTRTRGLCVPEADLWLDAPSRRAYSFISHAHSDHFARHDVSLCSAPTQALIEARYGVPRRGVRHAPAFGQPVARGGFSMCLHHAGHILGSAMLHLTRQDDGATLLYTGDFKMRDSLTCSRAQPQPADTLVIETTFGLPRFRFPPREEIVAAVHRFVWETFDAGRVPVLLGYSLGKAQEILALLQGIGAPIMCHDSVEKMSEVFRTQGCALPETVPLDPARAVGHVVVAPPQSARVLREAMLCRTAMLSGWALEKSAKYRYGVDEVFPLSDHADHAELLQMVEQTRPRVVYTVHGYTTEFAAELRRRGIEAWSLVNNDQLELPLERA